MSVPYPSLAAALTGHDEPLVRGHAAWGLGCYPDRAARHALDRARASETDQYVREEIIQALESPST